LSLKVVIFFIAHSDSVFMDILYFQSISLINNLAIF